MHCHKNNTYREQVSSVVTSEQHVYTKGEASSLSDIIYIYQIITKSFYPSPTPSPMLEVSSN
jgi:hypothetical protein